MAFWGVEVKPGKPFTHLPRSVGGRLHVSQATLGFGTATQKSVVQCNVGNRSPVFLCSLFPDRAESCQLNLEFEEIDEVVFSVIGPRSVHLTGYYLGASRQYKLDDESESYGEDILDTETDRSDGIGDEDEYEDSFIDDDDLQVIPPSQSLSDEVAEETLRGGRKKGSKEKSAKGERRRLRKKYQSSQTDDDFTSQKQALSNGGMGIMDSEGEDTTIISSLVKSAARANKQGAEEDTGQTIVTDSELLRNPHEYDYTQPSNVANDAKPKKKMKTKRMEEKELKVEDNFFCGQVLTWDKAQQNETKVDQLNQDTALMNGDAKKSEKDKGENPLHLSLPSDEVIGGVVAKTGKSKKKQAKETKALGVNKTSTNVDKEDKSQEAGGGKIEQDSLLDSHKDEKQANDEGGNPLHLSLPSDEVMHEIVANTGKREKKQAKEQKDLRPNIPVDNSSREDQAQPDEARCENTAEGNLLQSEVFEKQANDEGGNPLHSSLPSDELVHEIVAKTGKRKKKQVKEQKDLRADIPVDNSSREDQAQPDEARCENTAEGSLLQSEAFEKQANDEGGNPLNLSLPSDELVHEIVAKTGKRKKKQAKEEKDLRANIPVDNSSRGDPAQPDEAMSTAEGSLLQSGVFEKQANDEGGNPLHLSLPSDELVHEIVAKTGKRRKKQVKEEKDLSANIHVDNSSREDQAQPDEARCENTSEGSLLQSGVFDKQANDEVGNALNLSLPSDELVHEIVAKPGRRKKKLAEEEKDLRANITVDNSSRVDQTLPDQARCENTAEGSLLESGVFEKQANDEGGNPLNLSLPSDELVHEIVAKTGKRKKKQAKEEKDLSANIPVDNSNREDQAQPDEAMCENTAGGSLLQSGVFEKQVNDKGVKLLHSDEIETVPKPKKKRKKPAKDEAPEADTNSSKLLTDEKANGDEKNQMQTINVDVDSNVDQSSNENHNVRKKKKKSRVQENGEALNTDQSISISVLDAKENNANGKSKKVSRVKKRDGAVAAP